MKTIYFILIATLWSSGITAQVNLVKNGGFEQYRQCPLTGDDLLYVNFWTSIDTNLTAMDCMPDYCNACDTGNIVGVPVGIGYRHTARSGNGMVGERLFLQGPDSTFIWRDYLQGRLLDTLVSGKNYCITFYITISQGSEYAVNDIGAYVDDGSIDAGKDSFTCSLPQLAYSPQVVLTTISNDTLNWAKIQGSFTATAGEKFITIGNFSAQSVVDTVTRHSIWYCAGCSYYLVDDVSVIESNTVANAGPDQWVSPGSDSAFIGIPDEGLPTAWYIVGNTNPICYGAGGFKVHPDTTTVYVVELDLCDGLTLDTVVVHVAPASQTDPPRQLEQVRVFPVPARQQITLSGAKGSRVRLCDLTGRTILILDVDTNDQTIDISMLPQGIYLLEAEDRESRGKVLRKVVKE